MNKRNKTFNQTSRKIIFFFVHNGFYWFFSIHWSNYFVLVCQSQGGKNGGGAMSKQLWPSNGEGTGIAVGHSQEPIFSSFRSVLLHGYSLHKVRYDGVGARGLTSPCICQSMTFVKNVRFYELYNRIVKCMNISRASRRTQTRAPERKGYKKDQTREYINI